jgi:K+:H+ antiporter
LVLLAVCLGTAALTEAVGLSLALGAFAAGLMVSASSFARRALAQMLPLRDAFVALFFVTVGVLINPRAVVGYPGLLVTILLLVVLGKIVVWTTIVKLFRYPWGTAMLVGAGLTRSASFRSSWSRSLTPMGCSAIRSTTPPWPLRSSRFC